MKFIINETGKQEELSIIDTKTGMDWSNDLIGNSGAVGQYIEYDDVEDAYRINQYDPYLSAGPLYDGGWRAEDREQLISEYGLSEDEVDIICARLSELEADSKEDEDV